MCPDFESASGEISLLDYGIGNVASIANMLERVGVRYSLAASEESVLRATALILPGVGAFDPAMKALRERGLVEALTETATVRKVPILGLCLGMQLQLSSSDEGETAGLGWIDGTSRRFRQVGGQPPIRVPHMGWNRVTWLQDHPLVAGFGDDARFYFVHSYHVTGIDPAHVVATAPHGIKFPAVIASGNLLGVQFHPEKSHRFGMQLLSNFATIAGAVRT